MIIDTQKEIIAGYVTPENEVFSDAPEYIKKMAEDCNQEHKDIFGTEFFKFIDEKSYIREPVPDFIQEVRDELAQKYQ